MQVNYWPDENIVLCRGTYEEGQAYYNAKILHPARMVNLDWCKAANAYVGKGDSTTVETLVSIIIEAEAQGLPGLTDAATPAPVKRLAKLPGAATYTVVFNGDAADRVTVKIHGVGPGSKMTLKEGQFIVSYLNGPDNERSYAGLGFIDAVKGFSPWKKNSGHPMLDKVAVALEVICRDDESAAQGREAYAMQSGNCARCGRKLTVPASIHRGMGIECASHFE